VPLGKKGLMSQNFVEAFSNQNDMFMLKRERERERERENV
jgi:hypothetical protein